MADLFTTPSWESVMGSRPRTRTRAPVQTPLPGGGYTAPGTSVNDGVLTSPGIPESEVNQPERPPTPGPALPVPRYEDMLNAAPGPDWSAAAPTRTSYGRPAQGNRTLPNFGQYGESGENASGWLSGLFGGLADSEGGFDIGNFNPWNRDGSRRGGGTGSGGTGSGGSGSDWTGGGIGSGMIATGSPYSGRTGMSASDVEFWNLPGDRRAAYFERMAMRSVGDYDRDPETGEVIGGPKTTAIRQLMGDLEQTAREQLQQLGGYMPRVSY